MNLKKQFILFLVFFQFAFGLTPSPALILNVSEIIEERHHLFILGILSYLHTQLEYHPKTGYEIAALLAWDVENVDVTPQFVLDKNRNFEKQGSIFHAEMMAIERAVIKNQIPNLDLSKISSEFHQQQTHKLANTTLYSSMEPCPFCTMGITWSRIPKAIYFMPDPGMWHGENTLFSSFPKKFFGRKLAKIQLSSLPLALKVDQELRSMLSKDPLEQYVVTSPEGEKILDFPRYFADHHKSLFRLGHELFCSYEVLYDQNKELFSNLAEAIETLSQ